MNGPSPRDWTLLTEVSTDPNHGPDEIQEGNGVLDLPVYYGDKYLFVATAPDNTFTNQPYKTTLWTAGHAAYDVSDPAKPELLSNWWVPGSRAGEETDSQYLADNERWNNKTSWFGSRMGIFLPRSVESGWKYGYAAQGGQGFFVLRRVRPRQHPTTSAGATCRSASPAPRATTSTPHRSRRRATSTSRATR